MSMKYTYEMVREKAFNNVTLAPCIVPPTLNEFYRDVPNQSCKDEMLSLSLSSVYAIPTMVFSFQCHASVLPIYADFKNASKRKMQVHFFSYYIFVLIFYSVRVDCINRPCSDNVSLGLLVRISDFQSR